jgi:hypothetical protein
MMCAKLAVAASNKEYIRKTQARAYEKHIETLRKIRPEKPKFPHLFPEKRSKTIKNLTLREKIAENQRITGAFLLQREELNCEDWRIHFCAHQRNVSRIALSLKTKQLCDLYQNERRKNLSNIL